MRKNRFLIVFGFCLVFFVMSFYLGYKLMDLSIEDKKIGQIEDIPRQEEIEIVREENRISPNTYIESRIQYLECGHLVTKNELAKAEVVNLTREEFEDYLSKNYPYLRLVSFSNTKIVLFGEKDHLCQEHYVIGEQEGYVAIFNIDENGERVLYKSFKEYPISLLQKMDQDKLREGIVVDSEEELSNILENFIS
ncbi:MAG: hypothetical protein GX185_08460 [Tissierellia bacterium]|nr:hypothetical protein [Tissierellia bacterium]